MGNTKSEKTKLCWGAQGWAVRWHRCDVRRPGSSEHGWQLGMWL